METMDKQTTDIGQQQNSDQQQQQQQQWTRNTGHQTMVNNTQTVDNKQ